MEVFHYTYLPTYLPRVVSAYTSGRKGRECCFDASGRFLKRRIGRAR